MSELQANNRPKGMMVKIKCESCGGFFERSSKQLETRNCRKKDCVWKNYGITKQSYEELKRQRRDKRLRWEEQRVQKLIDNEALRDYRGH